MPFLDRSDAGRRLARALSDYKKLRPVILALPRGGVPVAAEVASALEAPLDLILVRKIGAPMDPELAMGAVVDSAEPIVVRNDDVIRLAGVTESEFNAARRKELAEIERRRVRYLAGSARADVAGQVVIVIDDGVATGATMMVALRWVRSKKAREVVAAAPVAPPSTVEELREVADRVICPNIIEPFYAIGAFYGNFSQVSDEEVEEILQEYWNRPAGGPTRWSTSR